MRSEDQRGLGYLYGNKQNGGFKWDVLNIIISLNILIFFLQSAGFGIFDGNRNAGGLTWDGLNTGYIWLLFTYAFLHDGIFHLVFNLLIVWMCGRVVLDTIKTKRFLVLYFVGVICAALFQLIYNKILVVTGLVLTDSILIGASGGAMTLLLAFTTLMPFQEVNILLFFVWPIKTTGRNLARGILLVTVALVFVSLVFQILGKNFLLISNVAHMAHLGGALFGYFYMKQCLETSLFKSNDYVKSTISNVSKLPVYIKAPFQKKFPKNIVKLKNVKNTKLDKKALSKQVDIILDKISVSGISSLTAEEKKILEEGSKLLSDN